ncbi:MAG TPA: alpha-amylase family protein, partial [Planctomycetaceae bacterium]|nr:alpha-amylase family protein [Planctomycetaceae bacterium]
MMSLRLSVILAIGFTTGSLAAQDHKLWDGKVMPQPFERQPFHRIRIPAWVQDTIGCGYTLSGMDTAARTAAAKHGVTLSELTFVDPFYPYYDSQLLKRRSPHVPLGRLEKDIAEYQKLGVRILGVYPPTLQGEVYESHPDWRRIAIKTTEIPTIDLEKYPHGGMLCPLGPYGDFMIEVLAEILAKYPMVDAFSFDGLHHGGVCYCQHCRRNYRDETGGEIPNADLHTPEFRRYQHWADRRLEGLVRRMQIRLKGIKPDVALVTWSTNAGRWGHFLSVPRNMPTRMNLLFDAPDQEFWMDESNRGNTILPAFTNVYLWAVTDHRVGFSEPYLMSHGNPYGKDSFPPAEIERRMLLALTYGASPSIAVAQPPRLQTELYRCMDEVQLRKPWVTHKAPERWAALLMSDNTRTFYARDAGQVETRYLSAVLGAFRACVEEHLPVTVINDWNLNAEDLAKYRVLILPNAACLDQRQVAAIDEFVRNGGGLVASLETSLFDEFGDPRSNFALADVLGIDYRGPVTNGPASNELDVNFAISLGPDYWEKRKGIFDFRQDVDSFLNTGKMRTYVGPEPVTFKGAAVRVAAREGTRVIGSLQGKEASSQPTPAIVTREHGKGRVVSLVAGFDAAYYLYAYPYQRLVLKHAIQWAANSPPPIDVVAPMCVHTTIMRQQHAGHGRLVVHLFNDINTTG